MIDSFLAEFRIRGKDPQGKRRILCDNQNVIGERACQMAMFLVIYGHNPAVHVQLSYFEPTLLHRESKPLRDAHASIGRVAEPIERKPTCIYAVSK